MVEVVEWKLKFSPRAKKDADKLKASGLKEKAQGVLEIIKRNPWQTPPPYEKLVGDLQGKYSRRINIKHRIVYEIAEKEQEKGFKGIIKVLGMWTYYE
jgi:toxin YoeB